MNKKQLLALIAKKSEERAALKAKGLASEDITEVRSISSMVEMLDVNIAELRSMADAMPDDTAPSTGAPPEGEFRGEPKPGTAGVLGAPAPGGEQRSTPVGSTRIIDTYGVGGGQPEQRGGDAGELEDKYDTMEYRKAFMNHFLRGTPIAQEYRDDAFTTVADAAAVIPTTIMNNVIKQMKVRGQIYSRCRPTNIPGGVRYPILSLKPIAVRTTEGTVSARQKIQMNTYVSFDYLVLECRVATSMLTTAVTLPMFEDQITPLIVEAMTMTNEYEVFNGNGTTEMVGILVDTRVLAGQKITLSSTEFGEWDSWKKKVFSKVPLAYRSYEIFMGAGTFEGYIDSMTDANGQPIGRTNYGISDGPTYRFGGKTVIEVEEDVIKSYDNAATGDVVAVFVDLDEYAINSNMQMAMYRWLDHETNQWVNKAILINDGKLLDPVGVIIVIKGE